MTRLKDLVDNQKLLTIQLLQRIAFMKDLGLIVGILYLEGWDGVKNMAPILPKFIRKKTTLKRGLTKIKV